ncbi:MAG: TraR/DksA C4-type zinc finger protein [Acidimicrobiia bacterium]
MNATVVFPSQAPLSERKVIDRLRTRLVADRSTQAGLVAANRSIALALTGQRDVDSLLEREIADASAAHACEAVEAIDEALAQMAVGTYGECESCCAQIPLERLEAIPHARRCIRCS